MSGPAGKAVATVGQKAGLAEVLKQTAQAVPGAARLAENVMNLTGLSSYQEVPVYKSHPDTPAPIPQDYAPVETKMSKLANGVQVVTRDTYDLVGVVGMYVNGGSRLCQSGMSGAGHFLESIALEATQNRTALNVYTELQKAGANLQVQASRDGLMYQCELFRKDADFGLGMVKEIALEGRFEEWNFDNYRSQYLYRRGDEMGIAERQIPELMHQVAWQNNALGLPLWCDQFTVKNMTPDNLREFRSSFFQPNRIIVGGVGVEHERMVELSEQLFGDMDNGAEIAKVPSRYTGGEIRKTMALDDDFAHVALVFETENWHSADLMAMCTLNMMMGGGGHFSAGGPGKGMFTRIYQEALGRYSWLNGLHCSHSIYDDSAIFAYYGTALPSHAGDLVNVIVDQAKGAAERAASPEELQRAKTALATNICFDFEDRQVIFEDICRQVQVYGEHRTPNQWHDQINKITAKDVQRVAQKMLKSKPSLVAIGPDISEVPMYDDVCALFNK